MAHTKTYLKKAGVASQEAGQPLQGLEEALNETFLQESSARRSANLSRSQKWHSLSPT